MPNMQRGELGDVDPARVGHHQLEAALEDSLTDACPEHRVLLGGVGPDDQHGLGVAANVIEGVAHGAGAVAHREAGDGRGMAQPRAVIHVVRTDHLARELLREVVFLVRALRGRQQSDRIGAGLALDAHQCLCDQVERRLPVGIDPVAAALRAGRALEQVPAHSRHLQTIRMVDEVVAVSPLHAQLHRVHGGRSDWKRRG